jgi:hypothetical protein
MLAAMGRVAAVVGVLVLLAGCGGSGKSAESKKTAGQVVADAKRAALQSRIVHVVGVTSDNGTPLKLDLWLGPVKSKGHLVEAGTAFDAIRIDGTVYVRGGAAFLRRLLGSVPKGTAGRWLSGSASSGPLAELAPLLDRDAFVTSALGQHGRIVNRGERQRNGETVIAIDDTTQGGTLYVAASGTPYPVALAGDASAIDFRDWDRNVTISAPRDALAIAEK